MHISVAFDVSAMTSCAIMCIGNRFTIVPHYDTYTTSGKRRHHQLCQVLISQNVERIYIILFDR